MAVVTFTRDYPAPPRAVWDVAKDYAALHEVSKPVVTFRNVPRSGHVRKGDHWGAMVRLFGILPEQRYDMRVTECDPQAMTFLSREKGAGVHRRDHRMTVEPAPGGSRLTDRIEIEAGPLTPVFAAWARFLYRRRHGPRLRLLGAKHEAVS